MFSSRILFLTVSCLFFFCEPNLLAGDNLDITVGLSHDKMTQGYYLTLIDTLALDEDSLSTLKQNSDELDATRLRATLEWNRISDNGNSFRIDNSFTGSHEDIRNTLGLRYKYRSLRFSNVFDTRAVLDTDSSGRNGYVSNVTEARFKPELGDGLFLVARDVFEVLRYDGTGEFIYDYNYNKFTVGFERQFGWTDLFSLTYRNDTRNVPDSSRLDLTKHRFRLQFDWSPITAINVRLNNELTRMLSEKESNLDDSWENYLEIELYTILSQSWYTTFRNQMEYIAYDTQDVVNFDYVYNITELKATRTISDELQFFAKPSISVFWSQRSDYEQQDYVQSDIEYGFDLSVGAGLWISASYKIGKRDYSNSTGEFYTDYILNQFNFLGDIQLYDGIRLNALISIDWESHDLNEDDNSLSLVSIGLDYRL